MNDFIDDNLLTLQMFYDKLKWTSTQAPDATPIPAIVKENALRWIHGQISLNVSKLNNELLTCKDFDNGAVSDFKLINLHSW